MADSVLHISDFHITNILQCFVTGPISAKPSLLRHEANFSCCHLFLYAVCWSALDVVFGMTVICYRALLLYRYLLLPWLQSTPVMLNGDIFLFGPNCWRGLLQTCMSWFKLHRPFILPDYLQESPDVVIFMTNLASLALHIGLCSAAYNLCDSGNKMTAFKLMYTSIISPPPRQSIT